MATFDRILAFCESEGLPLPEREHRFCPERQWRFDYAFVEEKIALEIEGGGWKRGRHHRPAGFADDCAKYNHAALLGWTVLRVTTDMVEDGRAFALLENALPKER